MAAAGAGPFDPKSGQLLQGGIEEQTRRVMDNVEAILAAVIAMR